MNIHKRYIQIHAGKAIAFLLIVLTVIIFIVFLKTTDPQYSSLLSGLATGFALATIQFFLSWYEYVKIDRYQKMKIIDIRPDRDNRDLYGSLISKANKEITILGVTVSRLMNDFADSSSAQSSRKVLLAALSRNVDVKILLPNKAYLEVTSQAQFEITKSKFVALKAQYPNFSFKYFENKPAHSIFLADQECILGPVFPGVSSKNTPSLHVDASSPIAKKYLDYFSSEWQNS